MLTGWLALVTDLFAIVARPFSWFSSKIKPFPDVKILGKQKRHTNQDAMEERCHFFMKAKMMNLH
ncbi:hypothetical protein Pelsub_P1322 [Pelolinea submarina]|nr:hypothetical protein Pelsub_P1322 [Pelolinea submarina]